MNIWGDILIIIIISLILSAIYTYLRKLIHTDHLEPGVISILGYSVSLVGFFLTLLLSFTITSYATRYSLLKNQILQDSEDLMLLIKYLKRLPNTSSILDSISKYATYIAGRIDEGVSFIDGVHDELYNDINDKVLEYVQNNSTPFNSELLSRLKSSEAISRDYDNRANRYIFYMCIFFAVLTLIGFLYISVPDVKIMFTIDFCLIGIIVASLYIIYIYGQPFGNASIGINSQSYQDVLKMLQK